MTNKIRMRMGPLSVVSTIAVIGLLAAFIALTALPGGAYAARPCTRLRLRLRRAAVLDAPPPPPPPVPAAQPLPPPTSVMAEASASQELTVTWMSVTGASSYQVDYKLASATDYQLAAIVGANATSYTIMPICSPIATTAFVVTAIGTSGQSLNSTPVVITVMTAPVAYDLLLSHEDSEREYHLRRPDVAAPSVRVRGLGL